jgi:hypothetical protein
MLHTSCLLRRAGHVAECAWQPYHMSDDPTDSGVHWAITLEDSCRTSREFSFS